jgi:ADP-ribosylglycohydrolase
MKQKDLTRFRGCMLGGAAGDALSVPVRTLGQNEIREKYGESGIQKYELVNREAPISAVTQLTMFTAEGLMHGAALRSMRRESNLTEGLEYFIYDSYLHWLSGQDGGCETKKSDRENWLSEYEELKADRGCDGVTLGVLKSGVMGSIEKPANDENGNSALLRVAPIGLLIERTEDNKDDIALLGAKTAAITHGAPLAYIAAGAYTDIISGIAFEEFEADDSNALADIVRAAADTVRRIFAGDDAETVAGKLERAVELAEAGGDDDAAITELGQGYTAEEALAIGVYAGLKYRGDFEKALCVSASHGGDSSTAAITGSIVGALLGNTKIPFYFTVPLELRGAIQELADDLFYGIFQLG